ncbi:MAG: hypothetical protein ACRD6I_13990 [Candidatus Acidiferrales bacterium]
MPHAAIALSTAMVEVARSGELPYETGTFRQTLLTAAGQSMHLTNKYLP